VNDLSKLEGASSELDRFPMRTLEKQDYEEWAADPGRYELFREPAGFPGFSWINEATHRQALWLRVSFHQWRRKFCVAPARENLLEQQGCEGARLIDRLPEECIMRSVVALTQDFCHAIEPQARALGVPADALLWAGMMNVGVVSKDYTFGDMLRVLTRAYEYWDRANLQFEDGPELEAFVFSVVVRLSEGAPIDLIVEYKILRDFCDFMELAGANSDFGKAMACGLPSGPWLSDVKAFNDHALLAAAKFDDMEFESFIPF
jgi:hypothetical protein